VKKLILLTLALALLSFTANPAVAHPPTPYCSCEFCSANEDKVCDDELIGYVHFCNEYSALNCPSH